MSPSTQVTWSSFLACGLVPGRREMGTAPEVWPFPSPGEAGAMRPAHLTPSVAVTGAETGRTATLTWLFLARFGKVGDTGVRAHEHIAGVQQPLQETLLGFRNVNPSERSLGQGVGRNQRQTVHAHLVDAVDRLEGNTTSSEGRRVTPDTPPGHGRPGLSRSRLRGPGGCTGETRSSEGREDTLLDKRTRKDVHPFLSSDTHAYCASVHKLVNPKVRLFRKESQMSPWGCGAETGLLRIHPVLRSDFGGIYIFYNGKT